MYSASELLERERYKKGITREKLTRGICSQQLLIKATESGSDIDLLTFEMLLERVGRSPERLEYIISKEEYNDIVIRDRIDEEANKGNVEMVKKHLNEYVPNMDKVSQSKKIYYYRTYAYALLKNADSDFWADAEGNIVNAIRIALPGITFDNYEEYMFSAYDIENILIYSLVLIKKGENKRASQILIKVFSFSKSHYSDELLQARILVKCAFLICEYCEATIDIDERLKYCEDAIALIRNTGTIYMLAPLLDKKIEYSKKLCRETGIDLWINIRDVVKEVLKEFEPDIEQDSLIFKWKKAAYHLDSQVIYAERIRKKMSQQELAEGIFSNFASISYIENNKCSPNKSKFKEIMVRLGISKPRRGGFVLTDSFNFLETVENIRKSCSKQDYVGVLKLIEQMEDKERITSEIINAYKITADSFINKTTDERMLAYLSNNIEDTFSLSSNKYLRKPFQAEMDIIVSYAWRLKNESRNEAVNVFRRIIEALENDVINGKYFYRILAAANSNYINCAEGLLSHDEIIRISDKTIKVSLQSGNGAAISDAYWVRYRALHENEVLKRSYYFSELYKEKTASIKKQRFQDCLN